MTLILCNQAILFDFRPIGYAVTIRGSYSLSHRFHRFTQIHTDSWLGFKVTQMIGDVIPKTPQKQCLNRKIWHKDAS